MKVSKAIKKNKKWIIAGALMFLLLASLSSNTTTTNNLDEIMRTSYLGTQNKRGIRNNNPLNIKYSDRNYIGKIDIDRNTDRVHEQFESLVFGVAAAIKHMRERYIMRAGWTVANCEIPKRSFTSPFDTLRLIANVWAPKGCDPSAGLPGGNNPEEYVKFVTGQTNITGDEKIDPNNQEQMKRLIWGMALYENGMPYKNNVLSWDNWNIFFNVAWDIAV